ncbi:AAEL006451-PA [Aedes aegypti]|uniref:AAEL006451-PA n=1 Tax=Aedes aegypti TaxID=7159 RepID=Q176C7_AEDAE|nr:AAEL006451-PA [Aedes aegypti]
MSGAPTRVIQLAKEKSQKFFASESEKFSYKIDKFLTVYQGYNQIKPRVFPKRLTTMFSKDVVATEDKRDYFSSPPSSTSSLRRHQRERGLREGDVDTSSKIRIVLPAPQSETNRSTSTPTITLRSLVTPRTRRAVHAAAGPKTPSKVMLTNPERGNEAILCPSVMLTYQEGLFRKDRDMVRNDIDV